jgi:hypothetical protein
MSAHCSAEGLARVVYYVQLQVGDKSPRLIETFHFLFVLEAEEFGGCEITIM